MKRLYFKIPYETKKNISDSKLLELHKQYWTFISENRLDYKPDILLINCKYAGITNSCFLCEYAFRQGMKDICGHPVCFHCPVKEFRAGHCEWSPSPYKDWCTEEDPDKCKYWALQIANLEMEDRK